MWCLFAAPGILASTCYYFPKHFGLTSLPPYTEVKALDQNRAKPPPPLSQFHLCCNIHRNCLPATAKQLHVLIVASGWPRILLLLSLLLFQLLCGPFLCVLYLFCYFEGKVFGPASTQPHDGALSWLVSTCYCNVNVKWHSEVGQSHQVTSCRLLHNCQMLILLVMDLDWIWTGNLATKCFVQPDIQLYYVI